MALQQYFQDAYAQHEMVDGNGPSVPKWKSVAAAAKASDNSNGCFDCNICLDDARDPVVTLCGHLYCWPCIYKWLHFQSASADSDQQPQCPVCKADISHTTLVPLYGRGQSSLEIESEDKVTIPGVEIPCRPPATTFIQQLHGSSYELQSQVQSDQQQQQQQYHTQNYSNFAASPPMFNTGEMIYARVFGNNSNEVGGVYGYPNSYHFMSSISPRMRRQEMKIEKSLNRVSIFLFCCFLFCLLMF